MSKKQRFIKVHAHSFHILLDALKKYEIKNSPVKVKNLSLDKFLLRASNFETSRAFLPYEVKTAILLTYGTPNPDPARLKDDKSMSDFDFNNMQYIALTRRFNRIAQSHNPAAKIISVDSVVNCDKVIDCITLVSNAASFTIRQIPGL